MTTADRERLREIKSFPSLVKYLRDELDWPIEADDFDELTFDYAPEELGIDAATAAKIQEIKQLRPLVTGQPWGIFFVKFEPKRLPVVALRRILSQLVIKKRASVRKAEQAAWNLHDLLFISNYGEGEQRQITFAHFAQEDGTSDLPTLKVLGWDDADTALHIDHVHTELKEHLAWPDDQADLGDWRQRWSAAFTLRHREVITTSKQLAVQLAGCATKIRKRVNSVLQVETEKGPLRKLMAAFKEALIHDLSEDDFADTYAQTITYGLLTAAVSRTEPGEGTALVATDVKDMVPVTNPFLRDMLSTFLTVGGRKSKLDFDEVGISEVVEVLRSPDTHMDAILRDFGDRNPQEDPVVHFYELFLKEYDPKKRMQRGVFYTPRPVVSFIVRSVHEILQKEFGLADGLADTTTWGEMAKKHKGLTIPKGAKPTDPFVQILDPACGTGTFLVEVIDVINKTMKAKWQKAGHTEMYDIPKLWSDYVADHLLPRLYGFELMMAPYAVAHMKVGLKLHETGYNFRSHERARVYLTNTLEEPKDFSDRFEFDAPALANEARAVNIVKQTLPSTVVIGNPPYSGLSANLSDEARQLVDRFKYIDGIKLNERGALQLEKNLQDDYIKFLAVAEDRVASSHVGICGMICNHGYIDNPTLRGVRWSLLTTFQKTWVLDLHGNVNRGERSPDGDGDQNVFDIKDAGVAILLAARMGTGMGVAATIQKSDLWGPRDSAKYPFLARQSVSTVQWQQVGCVPDLHLFRTLGGAGTEEYLRWPKVTEVFPLHSIGIITARDSYVIDYEPEPVVKRAVAFQQSKLDDVNTCKTLGIPIKKGWNIARARVRIGELKDVRTRIHPLLYRPFDIRPVFYHESLIWGMAWPVMQHMLGQKNIALITSRMTKGEDFNHVLASRTLSEVILLSSKTSNNAFVFPLRLVRDSSEFKLGSEVNLNPSFVSLIGQLFVGGTRAGQPASDVSSPEIVFAFMYATLHSQEYRTRYRDYLAVDFPRLPLTSNPNLFRALAIVGDELVALHLLESPKLDKPLTTFIGGRNPEVEKISWSQKTVWIDKAQTIGFKGVPEAVWSFRIGGYQVCEKWLKDRKGRTLSKDDIAHYHKIVVALSETIRLMGEIDKIIDAHGGWPGAFITDPKVLEGLKSGNA